ncbi:phage distal tail protein [Mammaliicoccus sciuri]|uniref:phage distal tail protein n=1 Tax=Mammaliicoccus sciuri TaxID=1296 RepID=UPI00194ED4A4
MEAKVIETIIINDEKLDWLIVERGFKIPSFNFATEVERVPGRDGAVLKERQLEPYEFDLPLIIRNDYLAGVKTHDDMLNKIVKFFDYDKPVKFKLSEKNWYWNAMFDGPFELDSTNFGFVQFSVKVILLDPYKYSDVEHQNTAISDQMTILNNGTAKTYPIIEARALKNSTSFMIAKNDEDYYMIGEDENVFKGVKDKTPIIYKTDGTSVSGWQYLPSQTIMQDNITGGVATGSIESNGNQIRVKDYGSRTGDGWYGPAVKRSLSKTVQDFEITACMKIFKRTEGVGKVFTHLYDDMGNIVCSLGLIDATNSSSNVRAYVSLHNEHQERWEWYSNAGKAAYDDAYVFINVRRLGENWRIKTWHFYIDEKGKRQITSRIKIFHNDTGKWYTAPIAQVGMYFSRHTKYNFLPLHLNSISLNEIIGGEEIPYIIKKGDDVYIDMNQELVLINNEDVLDVKTLGSDYFAIEEGLSELSIFPKSTFDTKAIWSDRFL